MEEIKITPIKFAKNIARALKESSSSTAFFFIQQAINPKHPEEVTWEDADKILTDIINSQFFVKPMTEEQIRGWLIERRKIVGDYFTLEFQVATLRAFQSLLNSQKPKQERGKEKELDMDFDTKDDLLAEGYTGEI